MSDCTHDCGSCSQNCKSRDPKSLLDKPHELSKIKKVIGIVSGKGGVGKSLVTSLLAVNSQKKGYNAAILDGDITGPSIPKMFGIRRKAVSDEVGLYPVLSGLGVQVMSINLLLENDSNPVVWRGPVIAGAVRQFWTDVVWGDVDYMFVDMPPGTGDVPLTAFQSLPLDGIIIVTSPQELVGMIVKKAVNMAKMMNVPVIGIVENMSYFVCPDCGKKHLLFGESKVDAIAKEFGIKNVAKIPFDPQLALECDRGLVEVYDGHFLDDMTRAVEEQPKKVW